jgi:ankyrin repeat protein
MLFFSGKTPLYFSAVNGQFEICRILLDSKADVNTTDREYLPPFQPSSSRFICETKICLRKLIVFFFFRGNTPLHRSAEGGFLEITRLLVESKADVAAGESMCVSPHSPPPPPSPSPISRLFSPTFCVEAMAKLRSNGLSKDAKKASLRTFAASAPRND